MSQLGLQAYRFSIAWPRILPNGRGAVNQAGLDFYSRLVDGLLEAGIKPNATLYHWDLPQVLQDAGGWPERMIVDAFAEYAEVVTHHLGDRVKMWATLNEPWVIAKVGYEFGAHAPGHLSQLEAVRAAHHLLLAHGTAVPVIRANAPAADVGIVVNLGPQMSASADPANLKAARLADGGLNRWFLDPLAGFGYPDDMAQEYGAAMDVVQMGDMAVTAAPIDFLGVSYYSRDVHGAEQNEPSAEFPQTVFVNDEFTEMGWEVYPEGLRDLLLRLHAHYRFPALFVTENGAAYADEPAGDGGVHDPQRISYYQRHFRTMAQALDLGVPLKGYFAWSLMDNFEWAFGYSKRFGLIYVDYETRERNLKDSAYWYRDIITANAAS